MFHSIIDFLNFEGSLFLTKPNEKTAIYFIRSLCMGMVGTKEVTKREWYVIFN